MNVKIINKINISIIIKKKIKLKILFKKKIKNKKINSVIKYFYIK